MLPVTRANDWRSRLFHRLRQSSALRERPLLRIAAVFLDGLRKVGYVDGGNVRIDARFAEMLAAGLLEEVRALYERGDLLPDLPSMRAVGYRQLWEHLAGLCTLEAAVRAAQQATRNLAKRQLTWLRGDDSIQWLRSLEDQELVPMLRAVSGAVPG